MCLKKPKHATAQHATPYSERIKNYAFEKNSCLELCATQDEVERVIQFLRKKWNV